jgi:hypothetical protein
MTSESDPKEPVNGGESRGEREIVDLLFNTLREFRQEMAPRLALDGMFVSTQEPLVRGTKVRFRFVLPEEFVLAQGDAVVAWRRTRSSHPDLEPGMALWFEEVDQRSRDIISELVDIQTTSGDEVFDTRRKAAEVGEFVANEFAGSFATSFDLPALTSPDEPEEPKESIPSEAPAVAAAPPTDSRTREPFQAADDASPEGAPEAEQSSGFESVSWGDAAADGARDFSAPEPAVAREEEFEVSLMADDSEPDVTPLSETAGPVPDLAVLMGDAEEKTPRPRWLLLAGAAVILLAAVAVVWWATQRSSEPPIQVAQQPVEAEPTAPAVVLLEDGEAEESAAESPESGGGGAQPAGELAKTGEEEAQPPPAVLDDEPATRVVDVGVTRLGDATVIGIRGNGSFDDTRLQVSMLNGPPRVLVRVAHIETYYRPSEIEVGSPEVLRVRVGHHPEETPVKLYVVIDLADASMVVRETSVVGETIRVVVGRE